MNADKNTIELSWISFILRLSMVVLFGVAAAYKFIAGYSTAVGYIISSVKDTFLPVWLVSPYAYALPFVEAVIAVWLLTGIKLKEAWGVTALLLVSLGFGLMVAKQSAADTYIFLMIACAGLFMSRYDCCALRKCCKK